MKYQTFALIIFASLPLLFLGCSSTSLRPGKNHSEVREITLDTTAYCNCRKCCSWKYNWHLQPVYASGPNKGKPKKVGITSSGKRARRGTIAADPKQFPTGTIIYVPGYGYGRVEDTGGAIKGNRIDLWMSTHASAKKWGRKSVKAKVWLPK